MWAGIAAARLGGRVGDISAAVEAGCAPGGRATASSRTTPATASVRRCTSRPDVPNVGRAGRGTRLVEGMALAVEPMVTLGTHETDVLDDDWTVVTADGSWAAHAEHTFALTDRGLWVLTALDGGEEALSALGVPFGPLS